MTIEGGSIKEIIRVSSKGVIDMSIGMFKIIISLTVQEMKNHTIICKQEIDIKKTTEPIIEIIEDLMITMMTEELIIIEE